MLVTATGELFARQDKLYLVLHARRDDELILRVITDNPRTEPALEECVGKAVVLKATLQLKAKMPELQDVYAVELYDPEPDKQLDGEWARARNREPLTPIRRDPDAEAPVVPVKPRGKPK